MVAVLNEEDVLPELLRRTTAVLDPLGDGPHEILFVDDGSVDGTRSMLRAAAATDSRVAALFLPAILAIRPPSLPGWWDTPEATLSPSTLVMATCRTALKQFRSCWLHWPKATMSCNAESARDAGESLTLRLCYFL